MSRIDALTNNEYNRDHGDLEMTSLCMFELEGGVEGGGIGAGEKRGNDIAIACFYSNKV